MAGAKIKYSVSQQFLKEKMLIMDTSIPDSIRNFLLALIDVNEALGAFEGIKPVMDKLTERQLTLAKSRISQIIKDLKILGIAEEKAWVDPITKKRIRQLEFKRVKPLSEHYHVKKSQLAKPQGRTSKKTLEEVSTFITNLGKGVHLNMTNEVDLRIDQFFCILDAAMKSSGRDTRRVIDVEYYFKKQDFIKIRAVTTSDKEDDIAHLSDQRAMRVINAHYMDEMESRQRRGLPVKDDGLMTVDLHDLVKKMGLALNNQNKEEARAMLGRLASTEFRIDAAQSEFYRTNFFWDTARFRYLTEFKALSELEEVDEDHNLFNMKGRYYYIRLHSDVVESLKRQAFISHPGLAKERLGLAQRLNNWSKAVVGVRPATDKDLQFTLDNFHERVHPASKYSNFKRDFIKLVEREASETFNEEEGSCITASIYGYIYQLTWCEEAYQHLSRRTGRRIRKDSAKVIVDIKRDANDAYVGDQSPHNLALRQEYQNALGQMDGY